MDKQQITKLKNIFDETAQHTQEGIEYWFARDLQQLLGYIQWRRFKETIERAKLSCQTSGNVPEKLPPYEDIKKLERRVKSKEKKLASKAGKLPKTNKD